MCVGERAMVELFRIAAAIELALTGLESAFHVGGLPLGGGHLQQIGLAFITAFVLIELGVGFRAALPFLKRLTGSVKRALFALFRWWRDRGNS